VTQAAARTFPRIGPAGCRDFKGFHTHCTYSKRPMRAFMPATRPRQAPMGSSIRPCSSFNRYTAS
jgi:hypothetical protein